MVCTGATVTEAAEEFTDQVSPSSSTESLNAPKQLVITLHGIRTFGGWQERLEKLLEGEAGARSVHVVNYKYGYFSVLAFLIPMFRWLVVRRFRTELKLLCDSSVWERIDIVGHSFGTHVLAWALHGIPKNSRPQINTIILAGSVLRASFPWRDLVGSGGVQRVVNDCGSQDRVLLFNQLFVLFTGMAGRIGFGGATHLNFRNRFFVFGHSGYFVDETEQPNDWMRTNWLPLLTGISDVESHDEREKPSWIEGILLTLANNAEPVKLTIYLALFSLPTWYVYQLYTAEQRARAAEAVQFSRAVENEALANQERDRAVAAEELAENQRDEALKSESNFLADFSRQSTLQGDAVTGILLGLSGLPDEFADSEVQRHRPFVAAAEASVAGAAIAQTEQFVLYGHDEAVVLAAYSPDGSRIVTASYDTRALLWDANSGAQAASLQGHEDRLTSVAFSPDGKFIATTSADHTARLWDGETGAILSMFTGHTERVENAVFSPNSTRIVTVSADHTARIWDVPSGRELIVLTGHEDEVRSADYSPDGSQIVTASLDTTIRLWNAATGEELSTLRGHGGNVLKVVFSPHGTSVLSASDDTTARLWDTVTSDLLVVLRGHEDSLTDVDFSSDGSRIVTSSGDNTARIWDSNNGLQLSVLRGQPRRCLERIVLSRRIESAHLRLGMALLEFGARL